MTDNKPDFYREIADLRDKLAEIRWRFEHESTHTADRRAEIIRAFLRAQQSLNELNEIGVGP